MKTFFIFIKGYGRYLDQEYYIAAETKEAAIKDFCNQHANIDPAVVEYSIQEVEDGTDEYDEMMENKLYAEKADIDKRDYYENTRGV